MDIARMRANFAKAAAAGDDAPLYFYSHLFLAHPETREMFPVSMAHQRDRLFAALGDVVDMVDDLDALVPVLQQLGRDHRKFGAVAAHYPAVGASLLATLQHFDPAWDDALAADWTAAYQLVAQVMIEAADAVEGQQPPWWEAEVVDHERRTVDTAVIHLRPHPAYVHLAGQSVSLESDLRPRLWRYYSPANAPRPDGLLEVHVKARDGGPVSTAMVRRLTVGHRVRVGPPMGHTTLDTASERDLLLVAGGVGWAPMKAIVDQVARFGPPRRVDVFVGARTEDAFYDRADMDRLVAQHPWLSICLAVSAEKGSRLEQGDVADVVMRHGPWTTRAVHVAGPGPMVDDVVGRLTAHGLPADRIRTEVFAPSRPGPDYDGKVTE